MKAFVTFVSMKPYDMTDRKDANGRPGPKGISAMVGGFKLKGTTKAEEQGNKSFLLKCDPDVAAEISKEMHRANGVPLLFDLDQELTGKGETAREVVTDCELLGSLNEYTFSREGIVQAAKQAPARPTANGQAPASPAPAPARA